LPFEDHIGGVFGLVMPSAKQILGSVPKMRMRS
jgi:hypothetical protein